MGKTAFLLYKWTWTFVDLLYPPTCGGCGKLGTRWCDDCQAATKLIGLPVCQRCGRRVAKKGLCTLCKKNLPDYTALRSWAAYEGPVRKAIQRLKYNGDMALGDALARPLNILLQELNWTIDLIVPVPMSKSREEERGYNQASLLALPLALKLSLPYKPQALVKVSDVRSQVGLSWEERQNNIFNAFLAKEYFVQDRSVLVVDDVVTSGATMNACTEALLKQGARQVFGLTLARAGKI